MVWCMGSERTWSGGFIGKWGNVLWAYRDQFSTDLVRIFTTRSSKTGVGNMKRSAGQRMGRREHAHTLAMALWSLLILRFRCERKHCKSTDGHAYSYKSDFNRSGGTDRYSFFPPSFSLRLLPSPSFFLLCANHPAMQDFGSCRGLPCSIHRAQVPNGALVKQISPSSSF